MRFSVWGRIFYENHGHQETKFNASGQLSPVAGSPFAVGTTPIGVVVSPNGAFLYVSNQGSNYVSALAINGSTGALTPVTGSPFATGITPGGITISPNGAFLYVANQSTNNVTALRPMQEPACSPR